MVEQCRLFDYGFSVFYLYIRIILLCFQTFSRILFKNRGFLLEKSVFFKLKTEKTGKNGKNREKRGKLKNGKNRTNGINRIINLHCTGLVL